MSELLAQLNPHSKDLRMLPPGFQALTAIDIAHALGRINKKGPRLLLRYKYAEHEQFFEPLNVELILTITKTAETEKWKNLATLSRLCHIAIQIVCRQPRCNKCKGIGERMWGSRRIVCPSCRGNSWQRIYDTDIAAQLGVEAKAYGKTYKKRLGAAMDILRDWEIVALASLKKSMRQT